MVRRSRLSRIRRKRESRRAVVYIFLAIGIMVALVTWGVPGMARLAGLLITQDTGVGGVSQLKPTPPIFSDIPEATKSASVTVGGFAQPGVEVVLYLDDTEYDKILCDDTGVFEFRNLPLSEGENEIYARAVSSRGQESESSRRYTIVVDRTPPELTLSSPEEGEVFRGQSQRIVTIQGVVSEEGAKVYVGERVAIVSPDGTFTVQYQLVDGDQEIPIKGVDRAGNETTQALKVRWEP